MKKKIVRHYDLRTRMKPLAKPDGLVGPVTINPCRWALLVLTLCVEFLGRPADAQSPDGGNVQSKKDTVSIFNNRLKITLRERVLEEIPKDLLTAKYSRLFGAGHLVNTHGLILFGGDTLAFYQTSIDRPMVNDGGVSTWKIIRLFADKIPSAHWLESGWTAAGMDFIYFVKLISEEETKQHFEFNFFFIDNKLTFSLLQRPFLQKYFSDQKNYSILFSK